MKPRRPNVKARIIVTREDDEFKREIRHIDRAIVNKQLYPIFNIS